MDYFKIGYHIYTIIWTPSLWALFWVHRTQ